MKLNQNCRLRHTVSFGAGLLTTFSLGLAKGWTLWRLATNSAQILGGRGPIADFAIPTDNYLMS